MSTARSGAAGGARTRPSAPDPALDAAGSGAAEDAQQKARHVASQAQDRAREAAGDARGRVRDEVDRRSTDLGDRIGGGAGDARSVADELRKQGKDTPARYVEQVADRAERLGGYLRESDGERILRDVEDVARRKPWAVAAGGLVLGFAASRMLKASSGRRYRSIGAESDVAVGSGHGTRAAPFEPHV